MSAAEETLAIQLRAAGIPFDREVTFAPPRKFRADFRIGGDLLVEVDGGTWMQKSRHGFGSGYARDCEKQASATILGYRVIRVTPEHVSSGVALQWIEQAAR